jgi:hypothetical protein
MSEIRLSLLLIESLDAAYRHEDFGGPEWLADWGQAVIELIRLSFPDQEESREALWGAARSLLWHLACSHVAEEMIWHFLNRPETFFRSLVMAWAHTPFFPIELRRDPRQLH